DGVQYRRAKLWQIILVAFNAFNGMAMYFLIGLASYSASIGCDFLHDDIEKVAQANIIATIVDGEEVYKA
ncbi:MAG: hypothetical protein IKM86_08010, partial [Acidaminococcaceae bacterium]|nr:hypothetical protein [Acidaminococcaceae bacterium]